MTSPGRRAARGSGSEHDGGDGTATALTVLHYDSAVGAAAGELRLRSLVEQGALTLVDALTVVWHPGQAHPKVGHVRGARSGSGGAARGATLGAVAGALVLAPVAGAAAGAGIGAVSKRLHGAGIDEGFLEEMKRRLTPGTSALLVLSRDVDVEALRPFLERSRARGDATLMHAELGEEAPGALRELLGEMPTLPGEDPAWPESGDPPPKG